MYVSRRSRGQRAANASIRRVPSTLTARDRSSASSKETDAAPWTISLTESASAGSIPRPGRSRSPATALTRSA